MHSPQHQYQLGWAADLAVLTARPSVETMHYKGPVGMRHYVLLFHTKLAATYTHMTHHQYLLLSSAVYTQKCLFIYDRALQVKT